jgi:hypothetical protein
LLARSIERLPQQWFPRSRGTRQALQHDKFALETVSPRRKATVFELELLDTCLEGRQPVGGPPGLAKGFDELRQSAQGAKAEVGRGAFVLPARPPPRFARELASLDDEDLFKTRAESGPMGQGVPSRLNQPGSVRGSRATIAAQKAIGHDAMARTKHCDTAWLVASASRRLCSAMVAACLRGEKAFGESLPPHGDQRVIPESYSIECGFFGSSASVQAFPGGFWSKSGQLAPRARKSPAR